MGALITQTQADIVEQVIIKGDLAQLTPAERVNYYRSVCDSIGLNPLTKPFEYINLKGKLTLYARKDATDQLRKINRISIGKPDITFQDDLIVVAVAARDPQGRQDSDIGVVKKGDMGGDVANALMKAVTKAKRRVTLSLCGLGWLDETEIETIPDAKPVIVLEDGKLGPVWPAESESPEPNGNGNGKAVTEPTTAEPQSNGAIEWPSVLLNRLVMHYKSGNIHEYKARLVKSTILKPDDKFAIITHWMDIYNTERAAGIEPDEAARRADADRQATKESA